MKSTFQRCEGDAPPHAVFNAFWSTFDAHYAVFDLRLHDTTWAAIGEEACTHVTPGMSDTALYDLLIGMVKHLDDGHTELDAPALGRDDDAEVSIYPNYEAVYGLEDLIEANYLAAPFVRAGDEEFSWGTIRGTRVGYLSITAMEDLGTPNGTSDEDVAAANAAMAKVAADLATTTDAMIVDIRANEGGWDTVSLAIAAWFAGPRTVAWSEQVRNGPDHDDLAPPVDTFVDAMHAGGFTGPVVLLTSGGTYSAAETFSLAMRVRDKVKLLGERSAGFLSDQIDGTLPNGWTFTYSGERYIAADGMVYEVTGIPVDTAVALDLPALAQNRDTMLEAALAQLAN